MMLTALERSGLVATMTYIRLPTSSLYVTSFIASISSGVLVVRGLQSLLLASRGVATSLQFSILKLFNISPKYLRLSKGNGSLVAISHYLDSKEICELT
jgi:hypothetical protein